MIVPFSAADFLDRALAVYRDRVGVVDEPDQPAPSLGDLTYADVGALAARQAARLDELGIGVGDRVAIVSHNSARLLTSFFGVAGYGRVLVPVNFRLSPDEVRYIVQHSGARVLYVDPELQDSLADVECEHTDGHPAQSCYVRGEVLESVRGREYLDRDPPPEATYRIGVGTNWIDDPAAGDVFAFSSAVVVRG